MMVRLGAAICAATTMVAYSSSSTGQPGDERLNKLSAMPPVIMGTASTYNPYRPGYRSGGTQTASGEPYDPTAWTAAIQIDLREMFGGVQYGKAYRPTYALVASADKQVIVKINDVGPLEPGRVIDFNEQTMRYFDPTLELGLISIKVTPLPGDDWSPGPIAKKG
jgi:rare lipoprotein A